MIPGYYCSEWKRNTISTLFQGGLVNSAKVQERNKAIEANFIQCPQVNNDNRITTTQEIKHTIRSNLGEPESQPQHIQDESKMKITTSIVITAIEMQL